MFVKFGQAAATRSDLLPPSLIKELSQLQSSAAPANPDAMRVVLEEELGASPQQVFGSFDWNPLAAASIGQVYRATLSSGEHVVVKVQRPQVADIVSRDTHAMLALARFIQRRTSIGLRLDVVAMTREFTEAVNQELDFTREARSAERVRLNRLDDKGVRIPKVYLGLCTRRMIVMEEIQGRPVTDEAALANSAVPREVLADRLLATYLAQILRDGVFHADPHPGNILLDSDGTIHLLDFGSSGILDAAVLDGLSGIIVAMALNDAEIFQRSVLGLIPMPPGTDMARLSADLTRFLAVQLQLAGGFDVQVFKAIIELLQRHRFVIPASFTLLARALISLDGTLHLVAPGYPLGERLSEVARPLLNPFQLGELRDEVQRELLKTLPALRNLPGHAEAIAAQLRAGQLSLGLP